MNITREQYDADILAAKVQALREVAALIDAEDMDVDYEESNYYAGRRHAADDIEARADELEGA